MKSMEVTLQTISPSGSGSAAPAGSLAHEIQGLFQDKLAIRIDGARTDLFAAGVLDSMSLVQLILELEQHFGLTLPLGDLGIESFRSLEDIANLIVARRSGAGVR